MMLCYPSPQCHSHTSYVLQAGKLGSALLRVLRAYELMAQFQSLAEEVVRWAPLVTKHMLGQELSCQYRSISQPTCKVRSNCRAFLLVSLC